MLLFYNPGETQPRPWHRAATPVAALAQRAPISTRVHTVALNFASPSLTGTGLSLPLSKALWEGQKLVVTIRQLYHHNASYKRYVRYSPTNFLCVTHWPPNKRKSPHRPTSTNLSPLPQPLTPWHFLICGFSILDSFPDPFYFVTGYPDVIILKKNKTNKANHSPALLRVLDLMVVNKLRSSWRPCFLSVETEDHSWDHTFPPTSYASGAN